ncbi:MAG: lysozyme inhibitor LprI family protein, partial [Methylocystis sp.]|nr:lysozyme inhibitor LprI family protein [Methylocystis sp.]
MTIRRFSLALFICAAPACANAQSFNCANAKSPSEKLICATPDLAKLDTALDEAASKALDVSLAERARFLTEQRRWLDERDKKCAIPAYDLAAGQRKSAIACLESAYRARNAAIEALVTKQAAARGADKTLCQRVVDSYKTIIGADPKAIFGKNAEKPLRAENPLTLLSERKDSGLALARGETIENYSAKKLERWARAQKPRFKISQNVKNEIVDLEDQLVTIDRAPGTNFHMTSATQGTAHCVFGNYFEVKNGVAWRAGEPPWPGEGDGACGVTRAFGTIGGRAVAFEDDDGAYSPSIDNHLSIMAWNRGFFAAPCTIDFEYDPGF